MSIFKRKGSPYYWFHFLFEGRHYQESTKFTNRRAAERAEAIRKTGLAQARAGMVERKPAPLLKDYAPRFLEKVRLELRASTHRRYSVSVENLLPWFGSKRLNEITAEAIGQFKEARLREGRAGATVNRDLAVLRRIFSVAFKDGLIVVTPFLARRVEFLRESRMERIITFEEERRYLTAASPLLRDVATIMLEMNLRPSEVFNLRREDLHLPIYVHIREGKTANAVRDVPVTERALEVLKRRLAEAEGDCLFSSGRRAGFDSSRPMADLHHAHLDALEKSKIAPAFRLYDLRHTYGTRAIEAGTDPLTLARLMGHADLKTTMRYVHLSKRHLAEAQKRIEDYRAEREIAEAEAAQRVSEAVQ